MERGRRGGSGMRWRRAGDIRGVVGPKTGSDSRHIHGPILVHQPGWQDSQLDFDGRRSI